MLTANTGPLLLQALVQYLPGLYDVFLQATQKGVRCKAPDLSFGSHAEHWGL